jgi:hypothetical protein
VSADAARMRVDRALEKLRGKLAKRGIASTSTALVALLAAQSTVAAPSDLASKIAAGAFNQGGAATVVGLKFGSVLAIGGAMLAIGGVAYSVHGNAGANAALAGSVDSYEPAAPATTEPFPPPAPIAVASAPAAASAPGRRSTDSSFSPFAGMQKFILKRLWDHDQITPDPEGLRWGFRLAIGAPRFLDFEAAASVLAEEGLVRINPLKGGVSLTRKGRLFCAANTQKIDGN